MHDRSPHAEARAPADVRRSLSDWGDGLCCAALAAVALGAATAVACWLWQIPPLR